MYKYTKRTISGTNHYYEDARASYYERLVFPVGFQNFVEISKNTNHPASGSAVPVRFKTLEFGDTEKIVLKKLGKPRFVIKDNGFSPLAFFYKEELMNHELLLQIHFFDNEFVLATQSIIDTDLKWREIVKITVIEKYGAESWKTARHEKNAVFADSEGNRIFLLESINLSIVYCSGQTKHYQQIENFTRMKLKKISDEVENIKTLLKDSF